MYNCFWVKHHTFICYSNFDAAHTPKFKKERIAYKMTWYTLIVKISHWTWNNLIKFYTAPATSPKLLRVLLRYRKRGWAEMKKFQPRLLSFYNETSCRRDESLSHFTDPWSRYVCGELSTFLSLPFFRRIVSCIVHERKKTFKIIFRS